MRLRSSFLVIGLVVGFTILAIAWAFLGARRATAPLARVKLPDGTWAQVEGVTFGTNHTFTKGSAILAKLRKHAPGKLKDLLPVHFSTSTTMGDEMLLLWYNRFDPATGTYVNANLDTFRVIDEHGCVLHVNSYGGGGAGPGYSVGSAYIRVFPRRQKTFKVQARSSPTTNIQWVVENPFVTNPPAWKVESTPVTRERDGVQFTLERIRGHFSGRDGWFEPRFTVMHGETNRTEWYRPRTEFADATGNRDSNRLCPYEPAWKLDVRFYKSHRAPFPEEQIWRITNAVVPPEGQMVALSQTGRIAGIMVKLIALCGAGQFSFSNGVCVASNVPTSNSSGESFSSSYSSGPDARVEMTFTRNEPSLIVDIDTLPRSDDVLIRFRDSEGRTFPADFRGSANKTYRYDIKVPKGSDASTPFDVEIIPQNPVRLEYVVEPPRPPVNAIPAKPF